MGKRYTRVNWKAYPSKTTKISADNFNKMDKGIDDNDNAIVALESSVTALTTKENANATSIAKINDDLTGITGTLAAGATSITLSSSKITTNSTFDFYTSIYGVNPTAVAVAAGKVTLTFDAQTAAMNVKVRVS